MNLFNEIGKWMEVDVGHKIEADIKWQGKCVISNNQFS